MKAAKMPFGDVDVVLFGGKGGVGKTTAAAACALELALATKKKRKVLVLSTDPAHSLADVFDCELGDDPRRVPGAPKNLEAREIDAKKAFEKERVRYRKAIDDLFASIFKGSMDASYDRRVLEDLVDMAPPGLDEIVAILSIVDAVSSHIVVVDTAPSGHTLRLLDLPKKALDWVHALMQIILKYRRVIGLGDLASDLMDLARRLRALIALLADEARCAFVVVARPAELPRVESERLVRGLDELGVPISAVVATAVNGGTCSRCRAVQARESPEIAALARLAKKRARMGTLFRTPAIHPPPIGATELLAWRAQWWT